MSVLLELTFCFDLFGLATLGCLSLVLFGLPEIRILESSLSMVRILLSSSSKKPWKVGLLLLSSGRAVFPFVLVSSNICNSLTLISCFYSST